MRSTPLTFSPVLSVIGRPVVLEAGTFTGWPYPRVKFGMLTTTALLGRGLTVKVDVRLSPGVPSPLPSSRAPVVLSNAFAPLFSVIVYVSGASRPAVLMNVMVVLLVLRTSDPVTGPVAWPTSVASAGPMVLVS